MSLILRQKRQYACCVSEDEILMADMRKGRKGGEPSVHCLSSSSGNMGDAGTVTRLLTGIDRRKARVALVLPLSAFEIVTVTVPPVAREAVARLLPYNLSKVIDRPVSDCIFDWQVAQKFKDRHELTVYLYPAAEFQKLRLEMQGRQKEIAWFEPDVFSACSYLEFCGKVPKDGGLICVLIWQKSISMVVYENERITLVRSVDLVVPLSPYRSDTEEEEGDRDGALEEAEERKEFSEVSESESGQVVMSVEGWEEEQEPVLDPFFFEEEDDILAGFDLQHDEDVAIVPPEEANSAPKPAEEAREQEDWQGYLQNINLELMRTADYHTSVLKGKSIKKVFVGGKEPFHEFLEKGIKGAMGVMVEPFPPITLEADCPEHLAALCIGALQR